MSEDWSFKSLHPMDMATKGSTYVVIKIYLFIIAECIRNKLNLLNINIIIYIEIIVLRSML